MTSQFYLGQRNILKFCFIPKLFSEYLWNLYWRIWSSEPKMFFVGSLRHVLILSSATLSYILLQWLPIGDCGIVNLSHLELFLLIKSGWLSCLPETISRRKSQVVPSSLILTLILKQFLLQNANLSHSCSL